MTKVCSCQQLISVLVVSFFFVSSYLSRDGEELETGQTDPGKSPWAAHP